MKVPNNEKNMTMGENYSHFISYIIKSIHYRKYVGSYPAKMAARSPMNHSGELKPRMQTPW